MSVSWTQENCEKCGAANWLCQGNPEDQTSTMGEELAADCWCCEGRWMLTDDAVLIEMAYENWQDVYPTFEAWYGSKDMSVQKGLQKL